VKNLSAKVAQESNIKQERKSIAIPGSSVKMHKISGKLNTQKSQPALQSARVAKKSLAADNKNSMLLIDDSCWPSSSVVRESGGGRPK
jgi:hypothetical protein